MPASYSDIFQGGVSAAGLFDQSRRISELGTTTVNELNTIGQEGISNTEFKPFSVASNTGNASVGADGSINAQLNAGQQGVSDAALGGAQSLFDQASVDPSTRQGAIFEQLMAGMAPGQERDRLGLEGRLQAQGRGGIQSSMFGGAPEQFALNKAQEEARLGAMTQAQTLGLQEQQQQGNMADLFNRSSLVQEAGLFNQLNPAIQGANLGQTGQLAGADIRAQTATAGQEARINAEKVAAELAAGGFAGVAQAAGSVGGLVDDAGGVVDFVKSFF